MLRDFQGEKQDPVLLEEEAAGSPREEVGGEPEGWCGPATASAQSAESQGPGPLGRY